jgi:hypothetical protein
MSKKIKISREVREKFLSMQNAFIEAFYKTKWSGLVKDVAMVIYRKTLMFNKISDCLSRKQIADALGFERDLSEPNSENKNESNITKAIRILETSLVISTRKRAMPTRGGYIDEYTILDPSQWLKYKPQRGVKSNTSKLSPKRCKSTSQRGVNLHSKEVCRDTPNKLNTNQTQIKDLGEQENTIPTGSEWTPSTSTLSPGDECQSGMETDIDQEELKMIPMDKVVIYARVFVEDKIGRSNDPIPSWDEYEQLVRDVIAGSEISNDPIQWSKYGILKDPEFLGLIEQYKNNF